MVLESEKRASSKKVHDEKDITSSVPQNQDTSISGSKHRESKTKEPLVVMPVTLGKAKPTATGNKEGSDGNDKAVNNSRRNSTSQIPRRVKQPTEGIALQICADQVPPTSKKEARKVSLEPFLSPSKPKIRGNRPSSQLSSNSASASPEKNKPTGHATDSHPSAQAVFPVLSVSNNRTSQQSAAAHMAVRTGEAVQKICYGPVQFADLLDAQNDVLTGRSVLDYSLLKRLDESIFHRSQEEREVLPDGGIRSLIINAETRLLLVVQQFMVTAALLPLHQNISGEIGADPLINFVDDAEAIVQYMLDDLRDQQVLFASSNTNLEGFIRERCNFAKASQSPSFYFRQQNPSVTLRYVQGLCETICGLWPHGRFFISAEVVNPHDSFTPAHFHRFESMTRAALASEMDRYFNDPGLLGHIVANDYRQLLRGAFPFLALLGQEAGWQARPERERDMSVDASFIESGVYKFTRTTFVREHLLVDRNRRIRIYVDEFEGTRFLVYFNHRIGRYVPVMRSDVRLIGLSRLGFEILQTYNLLFLSNPRSQKIAKRLGIDVLTVEKFDSVFVHRQLFEAPRAEEFFLFKDRLCLLQHRLVIFKPESWYDFIKGGYAEPIWTGVAWFMMTIILLVMASIIATVLVTVLTR